MPDAIQQLPGEVWTLIIHQLEEGFSYRWFSIDRKRFMASRKTLVALCQVSRFLRQQTLPILYRTVRLEGRKTLKQFHDTCRRDSQLGRHVRSLTFADSCATLRLRSYGQGKQQWPGHELLDLPEHCPNVQTLGFYRPFEYLADPYILLLDLYLGRTSPWSLSVQRLCLHFHFGHRMRNPFDRPGPTSTAVVPYALRHVDLDTTNADAEMVASLLMSPWFENVQSLFLARCYRLEDEIIPVLQKAFVGNLQIRARALTHRVVDLSRFPLGNVRAKLRYLNTERAFYHESEDSENDSEDESEESVDYSEDESEDQEDDREHMRNATVE